MRETLDLVVLPRLCTPVKRHKPSDMMNSKPASKRSIPSPAKVDQRAFLEAQRINWPSLLFAMLRGCGCASQALGGEPSILG